MIWEVKMIKISATKLRNNLFNYLDKASAGETIVIQRNNQDVARIVPTHQIDWRDKMSIKPELLVSPDELIKPIEDIWEEYV
jgi:prevent-host-death family protein